MLLPDINLLRSVSNRPEETRARAETRVHETTFKKNARASERMFSATTWLGPFRKR